MTRDNINQIKGNELYRYEISGRKLKIKPKKKKERKKAKRKEKNKKRETNHKRI